MMKTVLKTKPDIKSKPKMISSKIKPKAHGRYTTCIVQWRMGQNRQHYAIAEVEGKIVRWFAISINWEYEDYEMQWLEPYEMIGIDQGVTAYRPSGEKYWN